MNDPNREAFVRELLLQDEIFSGVAYERHEEELKKMIAGFVEEEKQQKMRRPWLLPIIKVASGLIVLDLLVLTLRRLGLVEVSAQILAVLGVACFPAMILAAGLVGWLVAVARERPGDDLGTSTKSGKKAVVSGGSTIGAGRASADKAKRNWWQKKPKCPSKIRKER